MLAGGQGGGSKGGGGHQRVAGRGGAKGLARFHVPGGGGPCATAHPSPPPRPPPLWGGGCAPSLLIPAPPVRSPPGGRTVLSGLSVEGSGGDHRAILQGRVSWWPAWVHRARRHGGRGRGLGGGWGGTLPAWTPRVTPPTPPLHHPSPWLLTCVVALCHWRPGSRRRNFSSGARWRCWRGALRGWGNTISLPLCLSV